MIVLGIFCSMPPGLSHSSTNQPTKAVKAASENFSRDIFFWLRFMETQKAPFYIDSKALAVFRLFKSFQLCSPSKG